MRVVPLSVGVVSRAWDEQHLELEAASRRLRAADVDGFTSAVGAAATRFRADWTRMTTEAGRACESEADRLRAVIADYVRTDETAGLRSRFLAGYLTELK